MPGKIDEGAVWARVAGQQGITGISRELLELLGEALTRQKEYRHLGLNLAAGEAETLRGLLFFYDGEKPAVTGTGMKSLSYMAALRRLMTLELHARGRYLALSQRMEEPEQGLLQDMADSAEARWKKLLSLAGK